MYLESKSIKSLVYCEDADFVLDETLLEQGSGPVNDDALSTDNEIYIVCDGAGNVYGISCYLGVRVILYCGDDWGDEVFLEDFKDIEWALVLVV